MRERRFTPSAGTARSELVVAAFVGLLIVPLFLRFVRGETDPATLATFGALAAAITFGYYTWRNRVVGLQTITFSRDAITAEDRRGRRHVPAGEVEGVRHTYAGGEQWVITTRGGDRVRLRLDGFTPEESSEIGRLVQAAADRGAGRPLEPAS